MLPIHQVTKWFAHRSRKRAATTVVLHATAGGTIDGAKAALRDRELSYHYVIGKDGRIEKLVPTGKVAFHAGQSEGPEGPGVNEYSIGVSMVNRNNGSDPYPEAQVRACAALIARLCEAIPDLQWVTTHKQISFPRKDDPRRFPVDRARGDLTYWRRQGVPD